MAECPVLVLLLPLLLFGGYAVFNNTAEGNPNGGWDTALSMNSVKGYLDYMATFSRAHFDDAHKALRKLKLEEAMQWERLKASNNTAELRDFLTQHPDIPFAPLVEKRLVSLSWVGAVRANTAEAYSEYIHLSQQGNYVRLRRRGASKTGRRCCLPLWNRLRILFRVTYRYFPLKRK